MKKTAAEGEAKRQREEEEEEEGEESHPLFQNLIRKYRFARCCGKLKTLLDTIGTFVWQQAEGGGSSKDADALPPNPKSPTKPMD